MKADNRDISFKKGWEKRRLGDIGKVITGSTPSTKDKDNYSSDDYCFIKPSDIVKDGISNLYDSEFHISQKGFDISRQLPVGSVLTTCIGIVGKVAILSTPATCNQQINAIIPSNIISSKFLAYSILGIRNILETIANAPVVPIINKKDFSNIKISVPPLTEQERIVSELDLLSGIIDKQKAQLKELDNLAQSIFYDMFGDPVENEKGWEIVLFKDIATFKNGLNYHPIKDGNAIKCIGVGDFQDRKELRCFDQIKEFAISETVEDSYYLQDGDIIIVRSNGSKGLVGRNMVIYPGCQKITYSGFCIRCRISAPTIMPRVLNRILSNKSTMMVLRQEGRGCNISNINQRILSSLPIIMPPIELQKEYANKVEMIEKQKELINLSIKETETLFNSRMHYYFN